MYGLPLNHGEVHDGPTPDHGTEALEPFLRLVEKRVRASLGGDGGRNAVEPRVLREASMHLALASGAKRARPILIDVLSGLTRLERWTAVDFAAAVELVHSASLLHDDVVDDADLRRGLPTVNAIWGNRMAVLAGDLVMTEALRILRPHGARVVDKAVDIIQEMTRAVSLEVLGRRDPEFGLGAWRRMAEGKTGALFGFGAWLVAWPSERSERFDRALRHLGVAFQIADDMAELVRGRDGGETAWQDLLAANPTFPVFACLGRPLAAKARAEVVDFWREPDLGHVEVIAALLLEHGVEADARAAITREVDMARRAFGVDVEHQAVQVVLRWAESLVAF